jgi:hypothetical protein
MSKERNTFKETLKKPVLSLKEKRALKKAKKSGKSGPILPENRS